MSKRYWLADLHFGHANICRYCNRPTLRKNDLDEKGEFVSSDTAIAAAERMDSFLIKNINGRVKSDDRVTHVGDFINYGKSRNIQGLRNKPLDYIKQLNGRYTFIWGNHDDQNQLKTDCRFMFVDIGPYKAFVAHYPIENLSMFHPQLIDYVINCTDIQICGHVHEKWKYKYYNHEKWNYSYLMYNVGIDIHKYRPISDDEIIRDVSRIVNERNKCLKL
jgi:calcineurin-like phosphoesterase family protein